MELHLHHYANSYIKNVFFLRSEIKIHTSYFNRNDTLHYYSYVSQQALYVISLKMEKRIAIGIY